MEIAIDNGSYYVGAKVPYGCGTSANLYIDVEAVFNTEHEAIRFALMKPEFAGRSNDYELEITEDFLWAHPKMWSLTKFVHGKWFTNTSWYSGGASTSGTLFSYRKDVTLKRIIKKLNSFHTLTADELEFLNGDINPKFIRQA